MEPPKVRRLKTLQRYEFPLTPHTEFVPVDKITVERMKQYLDSYGVMHIRTAGQNDGLVSPTFLYVTDTSGLEAINTELKGLRPGSYAIIFTTPFKTPIDLIWGVMGFFSTEYYLELIKGKTIRDITGGKRTPLTVINRDWNFEAVNMYALQETGLTEADIRSTVAAILPYKHTIYAFQEGEDLPQFTLEFGFNPPDIYFLDYTSVS